MNKDLALSKSQSIIVTIEGFAVDMISHWIGGGYFGWILSELYPDMPEITAGMLASSDISPVIAMAYISLRIKYMPAFRIKSKKIENLLAGIVLAWIVVFLQTLFLGKEISLAEDILNLPRPYFYVSLFSLMVWGPLIEETLTRGYFFEILRRKWGDTVALLISTLLFIIPHALGGYGLPALFFTFLGSAVFTFVYIQGGLIPAILTHMFVNSYLVFLNM